MEIKKLTSGFAVAGQITAADLDTLAAQGIKSIINNRPDHETPDQPESAELAAKAAALGMTFVQIPVASRSISDANIVDFHRSYQTLPGPMLAFCRSGMRSAALWALSEVATRHSDDVLATAGKAGYDLSAMRTRLQDRATQTTQFVSGFGFGKKVTADFADVLSKVTEELKKEGFGVLSDIDVAGTLKAKIGVDIPPYRILGACNPTLAHQAVSAVPEIGLLLPCNVLLRAEEDGQVSVSFMDPQSVLGLVDHPDILPLAGQVKEKLTRVLASI